MGLGGIGTGKAVPSCVRELVIETEAETSMERPKETVRDRDRERMRQSQKDRDTDINEQRRGHGGRQAVSKREKG